MGAGASAKHHHEETCGRSSSPDASVSSSRGPFSTSSFTAVEVGAVRGSATPQGGASSVAGLAARRAAQGRLSLTNPLQVVTRRHDLLSRKAVLGHLRAAQLRLSGDDHRRHIQNIERLADFYTLGAEVMPTSHNGMEVRHAIRIADSERVVIKVRAKSGSFVNAQEEKEWRHGTEFMLNLPKSGNIAQYFEVLEDKRYYYVVMEKVCGKDLFELLDCEGRLPIADCKAILRQLLAAVSALHERGCIHKDLKLENIMIDRGASTSAPSFHMSASLQTRCTTPGRPTQTLGICTGLIGSIETGPSTIRPPSQGVPSQGSQRRTPTDQEIAELSPEPVVKLIDFDTAEAWSPGGTRSAKNVVGTDQYIAQEAYAGNYSPASDVFAVGVIAYRLVTGRFPFSGATFDDEVGENWVGSPKMKEIQDRLVHYHIEYEVPPFPSEPMAVDVISSMLAVNEKDRPKASEALAHPWLVVSGLSPSPSRTATKMGNGPDCQ